MVLWLYPILVQSQDCNFNLTGKVVDFHNGETLELATVYIADLQRSTTTNAKGAYKFSNLCAGTYTITFTHPECAVKTVKVILNESVVRNVSLEHHINELDKIQVQVDVHDNHRSSQTQTRINQSTLESYSGGSLGDALESVAGVSALRTGNSVVKPIIQGLYGSRVAIVNRGLRQQDQEWGIEHAPNIDLNTASNITVVKGGSALRYGSDAIGGVIRIDSDRVIKKDTLKGRIITTGNSNGRGGVITGSMQNYRESGWYQQATLTYKRLGDYQSPDYVLSNTGSETAGINAALGYKKFKYGGSIDYSYYQSDLGILRAAHVGNVSDLVASINNRVPSVVREFVYDINEPKQTVEHHSLQASGFYRIAKLGKITGDYSFQFNNRKEFDIRIGDNAGKASLDMDLVTHQVALRLEVDALENYAIEAGVDGQYQVNTPDARTGIRRLIPDYTSSRLGIYVSANRQFDEWLLDTGIRYDFYNIKAQKFYFVSRWEERGYDRLFPEFERFVDGNQIFTEPDLDYNLFAATAGLKRFFGDHYDLSANASITSRAPNPGELYSDGLHHALATIELGQLDLQREESFKINTTFHVSDGAFDLEVSPYFNRLNNFIQLIPTGVETTIRGAFPVYNYTQIDARLMGVDLMASYVFFNKPHVTQSNHTTRSTVATPLVTIKTAMAYVHGQDLTRDAPLIDMPPFNVNSQLILHDVIVPSLNLTLTNQTVFEQNRFPNNDFIALIPNAQGSPTEQVVNISQPPAAFSLWGAGLNYAFAKAKLSLSVSNLLNTRYRNYLNRLRFYADDVGRDVQLQFIYKF